MNDGAFLRENACHSSPTVTWIGHATVLVQMDHVSFLTDPTWSSTASPLTFLGPRRFAAPGLAFEALPPDWSGRGVADQSATLWGGWVVTGPTREPLDEPPRRFQADARRCGLAEAAWTPALGETRAW